MLDQRPQPSGASGKDRTDRAFSALVRFADASAADWLSAEARDHGWSRNRFLNELVERLRTWFNLPLRLRALLECERACLRLSRLDYLEEVLARHFEQLHSEDRSSSLNHGGAVRRPRPSQE